MAADRSRVFIEDEFLGPRKLGVVWQEELVWGSTRSAGDVLLLVTEHLTSRCQEDSMFHT